MLPVEIASLAIVNVAILAALLLAGIYLHSLGATGRALGRMFFCACIELLLATISLYFIDTVRVLAVMRIVGRCIELLGVVQLLLHLLRRPKGRNVDETLIPERGNG